jgi:hypothetical protein
MQARSLARTGHGSAAALLFALQVACQSSPAPGALESSLCAACAPKAGGETSDFGNTVMVDCGRSDGPRALTEDEARTFALERPLAVIADGLSLPVGWVPDWEAGGPSRTAPSVLTMSFEVVSDPVIVVMEHCGSRVFIRVRAELETSDGALRASLSGSLHRHLHAEPPVDSGWQGEFSTDLREARGTIDLRMREAWSRVRGQGQRHGSLGVSLHLDAARGAHGTISASVGYAEFRDGRMLLVEYGPPRGPSAMVPIMGKFPFGGECMGTTDAAQADTLMATVMGQTPSTLAEEAHALLQRCGMRGAAAWRDGTATDLTVELSPAPALAPCVYTDQGAIHLSWAVTGSMGSEDGRLRAPLVRASAVLRDGVYQQLGVESARPDGVSATGYAYCYDGEMPPSWRGKVRNPRNGGTRDCLSLGLPDFCAPDTGAGWSSAR